MEAISTQVKGLIRDDNGISAMEYGLLAGLITILLVASIRIIGTGLQAMFEEVASLV
ncbi:Flp family type IVb pilin [Paraburkholderia sp. EG285A]|uniref:Flp family type IVb pilin n=1 Tax=Paraburkholderia sp. EG285A TaxID=3237009 RepID=UPI0034D19B1C